MKLLKKGESNMAIPFEPLTTKKLKKHFKKMIETNCNNKETNQHPKNETNGSGKISRIKLGRSGKHLETWIQRQINS